MKKNEIREMVEELKKKYDDFEQFQDKKSRDWIKFNLGEIKVPKGLEEQNLKIIPHEGKSYIIFTQCLGLSEETKKKRQQERREKTEKAKNVREEYKEQLKDIKKQIKEATKTGNDSLVESLKSKIADLVVKIEETKLR